MLVCFVPAVRKKAIIFRACPCVKRISNFLTLIGARDCTLEWHSGGYVLSYVGLALTIKVLRRHEYVLKGSIGPGNGNLQT